MIPPREFIRKIAPFSLLSAQELDAMVAALEVVLFEKGRTIYRKGQPPDYAYVIFSGLIGLSDGEAIVDTLARGELFGIPAPEGATAAYDASALEDSVCYAIETPQFTQALDQNPRFADFISAFMAKRFQSFRAASAGKQAVDEAAFAIEVRRIIYKQPVVCRASETILAAVASMQRHAVSSIVAIDSDRRPLGILTHKDLKRIILHGSAADRIAAHMSRPVRTVAASATLFETLAAMVEIGVDHAVVVTPGGQILGVVTRKDIQIHLEPTLSVAKLYRKVLKAATLDELQAIHQSLRFSVATLVVAGAGFFDLSRMLGAIHDALTVKAIEIAAPQSRHQSLAWVHMGSSGRREEIIATDQDNALILAAGERADWAAAAVSALERIGLPRCPGGYMASVPAWNQPLEAWIAHFGRWLAEPSADHVRFLSVFLDMRVVYGQEALLAELIRLGCATVPPACVRLLAADAIELEPPLGITGILRLHQGVDLKLTGIYPIVNGARALALGHGLLQVTNTRQRLEALQSDGALDEGLCHDLIEAYGLLQDLRLKRQARTVLQHMPADNRVSARDLSKMELLLLKEAFKIVRAFQRLLATRYDVARVVECSQL